MALQRDFFASRSTEPEIEIQMEDREKNDAITYVVPGARQLNADRLVRGILPLCGQHNLEMRVLALFRNDAG